jgi:hypothetical protein
MISNIIPKINENYSRHITIVDNFLENPDEIREYALTLSYEERGSVGVRTKPATFTPMYESVFEIILNNKIISNFDTHDDDISTNGCFQWCNAEIRPVIHADHGNRGGVLYLTPNAPSETGTAFYEHIETGHRSIKNLSATELDTIFINGHFDFTPFKEIDRVANVYNRLVLFDGRNFHSGTSYFGQTIEDSRLFQIFFFEVDEKNDLQNKHSGKRSIRINPIK